MTGREEILEELALLLGNVANASFYRSRQAAVTREQGVVMVLLPEQEAVMLRGGPAGLPATQAITQRDFTFKVIVIARGDIPDQVADAIAQAAHAAIMQDTTLGGLVARIIELGTKWDFELADLDAVVCEMRYQVRYQTLASNLAQTQ